MNTSEFNETPPDVIVSGGQTGADYGALIAAEKLGYETDGYVPRGYRTENGANYELRDRFGLRELTTKSYAERTRMNVDLSDAVCAFYFHSSPGTGRTIGYARTGKWKKGSESRRDGHRPVLVLGPDDKKDHVRKLHDFLERHAPEHLMVAGHRESSSPGIRTHVTSILTEALPPVD